MHKVPWSAWGPERFITEEEVRQFSQLTQNQQWIHTDAERAEKESPYGGIIVHGLFLVSLIPSLLPEGYALFDGMQVRIVRGFEKVRLPSPVYPGETVHARTKTLGTRTAPSGKGVIVNRGVEIWSLAGEKPTVACEMLLQYF